MIGTGRGSHHGSHPSRLLNTAQPVAGVNTLGHGIINAAAAVSYAKTHRHPGVAQDFAPRWYLLAAVIVRYSWALIQMLRRRAAGPLAATVDLAVNVTG